MSVKDDTRATPKPGGLNLTPEKRAMAAAYKGSINHGQLPVAPTPSPDIAGLARLSTARDEALEEAATVVERPAMSDRPFSSEELAERWGVSAQHIRDLIRIGSLRHFRVGRLIRIPATAVSEFEECQFTGSSSIEASSTPSGQTSREGRRERPFVPQTARKQNAA